MGRLKYWRGFIAALAAVIISEPDEGTTVRIHLPKTENVEEKKKEE